MSGYSYSQTPLVEGRALPMTGREEGVGFGGNTCYFSRAPREDIAEAGSGASEHLYLVKYVASLRRSLSIRRCDVNMTLMIVSYIRQVSPLGAEFAVPAHWHPSMSLSLLARNTHIKPFYLSETDEWWRVFTGSVDVTIGGVTRTVTPADGEVYVPKGVVHGLLVKKDVHAEFGERVDPDPIRKMLFLKLLLGKGGQEAPLSLVQAMRLFYEDGMIPST
jgi:hypothetical protein